MNEEYKGQKWLLHQCCGPCSMWPLDTLLHAGVDVTLLFFNPNIHPNMEWRRRMENASKAAAYYEIPLIVNPLCVPSAWRERANDGAGRCRFCYRVRLEHLAKVAHRLGIKYVSTTLLVSPWQNRDVLIEEGRRACEPYSIEFVPCDWRNGYRRGQQMAKEIGLYRQKYCGCILSLEASDFYEKIAREHDTLVLQDTLTRCDRSRLVSDGVFDEAVV
ncbi:MAG: epoxyqueuosine reductase QueH [Clostridiaceae bacterium]|jgi:predicted adenine nucleotide alpha hydrolase (AANH) superfamily ATPase|nr:epoxyqueuosine reductase QueH [Clostridiaceae bacterium]